jgi:hypothetical protein
MRLQTAPPDVRRQRVRNPFDNGGGLPEAASRSGHAENRQEFSRHFHRGRRRPYVPSSVGGNGQQKTRDRSDSRNAGGRRKPVDFQIRPRDLSGSKLSLPDVLSLDIIINIVCANNQVKVIKREDYTICVAIVICFVDESVTSHNQIFNEL